VEETRVFVRDVLAETDASPDLVDSAVLLVSELTTNAALHARTDVQVTVRFDAHRLWAEVKDWNTRMPQPCHTPPDATSGRGLQLVEALAARWGAERDRDGKRVWFVLEQGDARSNNGW
jgi:anti-sigma regulatory factor (Ser/Thr protein kinase)